PVARLGGSVRVTPAHPQLPRGYITTAGSVIYEWEPVHVYAPSCPIASRRLWFPGNPTQAGMAFQGDPDDSLQRCPQFFHRPGDGSRSLGLRHRWLVCTE